MAIRSKIVVSRTDDRIVLMLPGQHEDVRSHAIVTEDEAFCASSAMRRMAQSRERRSLTLGSESAGLRIERVDHAQMPIELHFDDSDGTTVVDLTRDDALGVADMLWGAHRSTGTFHGMTTVTGGVRRSEVQTSRQTVVPRADDVRMSDARLIGSLNRRVRGQGPEAKI